MPRKRHKQEVPARLNIKAIKDVGLCHSSEEVSVMDMERRA